MGNGSFGKLADGAPRGRVVHVHVQRESFAKALDQPVVLDEVHAAMACALGGVVERFPQGVVELVAVFARLFPSMTGAASLDVDAIGIAAEQAARALDHVDPAIGSRAVAVVPEVDGLAAGGANEADVHVAECESLFAFGIVGREMLASVELEASGVAAHRDDVVEPISTVDVHALGDRPQAVGGVEVAVSHNGVRPSPQSFALVAELEAPQVVQIAALADKGRISSMKNSSSQLTNSQALRLMKLTGSKSQAIEYNPAQMAKRQAPPVLRMFLVFISMFSVRTSGHDPV